MKKILITGICGFVGSKIARYLRNVHPDWTVGGIDSFCRAGSWTNKAALESLGIRVLHGDIRQASDVESLPAADWVIDAAANPSVLAGVDGKTSSRQLVEHNLQGTLNLLEYCKNQNAGFILLSTSRVYSIEPLARLKTEIVGDVSKRGGSRFRPSEGAIEAEGLSPRGVSETFSTTPPVSLYGSTKVTSEHIAIEYGLTFDFPVWVNRCGVLAGAGQFAHPAQGIFAFWIHSFRENQPLKYIGFDGQGHQVRDCLHPNDLGNLLVQQIQTGRESSAPPIVNVAGGIRNSMSLSELTAWCVQRFPEAANSIPVQTPEVRQFDIPWMVLDSDRAKEVWGWEPLTPMPAILEEIAMFADLNANWLSMTAR